MENLIELQTREILAEIPGEEYSDSINISDILINMEEIQKKKRKAPFILISSIFLLIGTIFPSSIYDIVSVFKDSNNFSFLLRISLENKTKFFLYMSYQVGIILLAIHVLTILVFNHRNSRKEEKYKYLRIYDKKLIKTILTEKENLEALIVKRWFLKEKKAINQDKAVKEEDLSRYSKEELICRFYLKYRLDNWEESTFLKTNILIKIATVTAPFTILSTITMIVLLLQEIPTENYISLIILFPILSIINFIVFGFLSFLKNIIFKTLGYLFILVNVIVHLGFFLMFFFLVNFNAYNQQYSSVVWTAFGFHVFLFIFYYFAMLTTIVLLITYISRRKRINELLNYYDYRITEVEKKTLNEANYKDNSRLVILYEKRRNLKSLSKLPISFTKYIAAITTYVGLLVLISGIVTYFFSIL